MNHNKQVIEAFVTELWGNRNVEAWDAYCSEDFIAHHGLADVPQSKEGVKRLSSYLIAAFPDTEIDIKFLLESDDLIIQRSTTRATHSGQYKDTRPTGKSYTWHSTHIYRLCDEKIVEQWSEERLEGLLWQLGSSHTPFSTPDQKPLHKMIATLMKSLARLVPGKTTRGSTPKEIEKKNLEVVGEFVQKFKNEQKYWVFPRLFDARFSHHFDFPNLPGSLDTFISVGQGFLPAFPDLKVNLQTLVANKDFVVERNIVNGTHLGAWVGVKPTGRKVSWTEIHIYRLENGKIMENWPLVNFERILMQLR